MRASDRDRERAVALLRARCVEGYLSVDTFEHRLGRVLRARSLAELRVLVGDLTRRRWTWPRWRTGVVPGDELFLGDCAVVLETSDA